MSRTAFRLRILASGFLTLIACLIISFFFSFAVTAAPTLQWILLAVLWVGMTGLWVLGSWVALKQQDKTKYVLTDDALVIRKKGWFGRSTNTLYRYDTILSVQSIVRAHGAYGTLELVLEKQDTVELSGIVSPNEYAKRIKQRAGAARSLRVNKSA